MMRRETRLVVEQPKFLFLYAGQRQAFSVLQNTKEEKFLWSCHRSCKLRKGGQPFC